MWLARDYYNILFFFWTKYYKLGLLVLVLSMQFSGFCFYWMMHFYWGGHAYYLFQDKVFTDITWPVISSGSSAFCLLSQLKYWKDILNTAVLLWPSNSAESYSRGALCEWKMVLELMLFKKIMRLRTSLSLNLLVAKTKITTFQANYHLHDISYFLVFYLLSKYFFSINIFFIWRTSTSYRTYTILTIKCFFFFYFSGSLPFCFKTVFKHLKKNLWNVSSITNIK